MGWLGRARCMTRLGRAGALLQADLAELPRDKGVLLARVLGGASWKLGDDAVGRESIERAGRRTGVTWAVEGARQERQQEPPSVRIDDNDFIRQHSFHEGPFVAFKEGRLRGLYRRDPRQEAFVMRLQELYGQLGKVFKKKHKRSGLTVVDNLDSQPEPPTWWQGVVRMMHDSPSQFASVDENPEDHLGGDSWPRTPRSDSPLGLYTYGGVGVGKTMLMDLFVVSAPPEFRVLRTHFHDFMLDIHSRLRTHTKTADPLTFVAQDISETHRVLALDEFFVTDVADAMILHRLFNQLWDQGIVLVATSNRKPEDLYEGGLQRDLFLPFIDKLKVHCQIHNLDSPVDYRKLARHQKGLYFTGPNAKADLEQSFASMCVGCPEVQNASVTVKMGRRLAVPRARGPHCYFTFDELCGQAVGAADYIALARRFHTVCLEGIPKITGASRSDAYRLVMLVDVLYDNRIRLVCTAETQPAELFTNILTQAEHQSVDPSLGADSGEAIVDDNLGFAKDRTVSRLIEMRGLDYQVEHSNRHAPELLLALAEAQERPKE